MIEEQAIFSYNDEKYIVMAIVSEEQIQYAFANRLNYFGDATTDDFAVFKCSNNGVAVVVDNALIQKLLPKFQQKIRREVFNLLGNEEAEV